ncbi:MAG: Smr/MutS family protein, partial [Chloroflexota bacterium]|nr:Smr/MutS family protein [Chloroflexota bacterium]
ILEKESVAVVTTHYQRLKLFSHNADRVQNASVDFNPKTLQPSYGLTIGLPGRSNALTVASNLKIPKQIIGRARQLLNPEDQKVDSLLADIYEHREIAVKANKQQENIRQQLETQKSDLQIRLNRIDEERRNILLGGHKQVEKELESIRSEISKIRRQLKQSELHNQVLGDAEKKVGGLEMKPVLLPKDRKSYNDITSPNDIRLGDHVYIARLRTKGVIVKLQNGEAEVQIGRLRVKSLIDELQLKKNTGEDSSNTKNTTVNVSIESPGMELHLRGQRIEDGLEKLDDYLTKAVIAELPWVRIIHGKGTGQMREAVRQALKAHSEVKSFRTGEQGEGGDGVTVAVLE